MGKVQARQTYIWGMAVCNVSICKSSDWMYHFRDSSASVIVIYYHSTAKEGADGQFRT